MKKILIICAVACLIFQDMNAQEFMPDSLFDSSISFRFAGPFSGGRCTAVTGVPQQSQSFYMCSTCGGVWYTDDAGDHWVNKSDEQIRCGSIGSVATSPSEPNMVYVGTGSSSAQGNVSPGIGVYRSSDAGKSWKHINYY